MKTLNVWYPIVWWALGVATYHVYACYRKQAKGLFIGGEIELIRKVSHYVD